MSINSETEKMNNIQKKMNSLCDGFFSLMKETIDNTPLKYENEIQKFIIVTLLNITTIILTSNYSNPYEFSKKNIESYIKDLKKFRDGHLKDMNNKEKQ